MELDELRIRRKWLIAFWISVVCGTVMMLLLDLGFITVIPELPPDMADFRSYMLAGLIAASVAAVIGWWVWYHCAYTKRGTKWLLFLIVTGVFSLFSTPLYFLKVPSAITPTTGYLAYQIFGYFLGLYVLYNNYWLFKVNNVRRAPVRAQYDSAFSVWKQTVAAKPAKELKWSEKLSLEESTVRKNWLIAYGIAAVGLLLFLVPIAYTILFFPASNFPMGTFENWMTFLGLGSFAIWASYYFPLHERGTKWLLFVMTAVTLLLVGAIAWDVWSWRAGEPINVILTAVIVVYGTYLLFSADALYLVNRARTRAGLAALTTKI